MKMMTGRPEPRSPGTSLPVADESDGAAPGWLPSVAITIATVVLVLLTPSLGAAASSSLSVGRQPDERNAATWYNRAFAQIDDLSVTDWEVIREYSTGPSGEPSQQLRAALERARGLIELMDRGSRREYADFEVKYEDGPRAILPHLRPIRRVSRLLNVDAMVRLHDGDSSGAADRLASIMRLAGHTTSDRVILSSLHGVVVFRRADERIQLGLDRAAFDAADAAKLLAAVEVLDTPDLMNMVEAVVMEQTMILRYFSPRLGQPESREEIFGMIPDQRLADITAGQAEAELAAYDGVMNRYIAALTDDDPDAARAAIEKIDQELENGEHGILAIVRGGDFLKMYDAIRKTETDIARRTASLASIVEGKVTPAEAANAALWYLRGIEQMSSMKTAWKDAISDFDPTRVPTPEVTRALNETYVDTSGIVAEFRAGSLKRRCDFTFTRRDKEAGLFIPKYAPGMRDALRLLQLDANRLAKAGDFSGALDRLGIAFRVAAHLSTDAPLVSSVIAHDAFNVNARLAGRLLAVRPQTGEEDRRAILSALRRMSAADPFAYASSMTQVRKEMTDRYSRRLLSSFSSYSSLNFDADEWKALGERLESFIADLDGGQLLFFQAMLNTLNNDGSPRAEPASGERAAKLSSLGLSALLSAARQEAPTFAQLLRSGRELSLFPVAKMRDIVGVNQRSANARSDLRTAIDRLLNSPRDTDERDDSQPSRRP